MENKRSEKKKSYQSLLILALFSIATLTLITTNVSADNEKIKFCLSEGQVLEFSECNPAMQDYTCTSTTCQLCVTQISENVYCPASLNACGQGCVPFGGEENNLPVITVSAPVNEYFTSSAKTISFKFSTTKPQEIDKCAVYLNDVKVKESTDPIVSGTNTLSYFVAEGFYEWQIKCTLRNSEVVVKSETRTMTVGSANPVLTLLEPANQLVYETATNINFKFQTTKPSKVDVCKLYMNEEIVNESTSIITSGINTLSYFANDDLYEWQIKCTLRNSNGIVFSQVRTLTVGSGIPEEEDNETGQENQTSIVLLTPENNFVGTGTQDVIFSAQFQNSINLSAFSSCNLKINEEATPINLSGLNNRTYSVTKSMAPGSYQWMVNCVGTTNITSISRLLTINSPPPASTGSSGGGGGGGGSSKKKLVVTNSTNSTNQTVTEFVPLEQENEEILVEEENSQINEQEPSQENPVSETATEAGGKSKLKFIVIAIIVVAGIGIFIARSLKPKNPKIKFKI